MNLNNLVLYTAKKTPISSSLLEKVEEEIGKALLLASDWGLSFWSLSKKAPSFGKLSVENREKLLEFLIWEEEIQTSPWSAPGKPIHAEDGNLFIHKNFVKELS
jgi:hypothetical protein